MVTGYTSIALAVTKQNFDFMKAIPKFVALDQRHFDVENVFVIVPRKIVANKETAAPKATRHFVLKH